MSRLDDHVAAVQNRLALRKFISALAWLSVIYAAVILIAVLVDRIFQVKPPNPVAWLYAGAAAVVVGALGYAFAHRPNAREAAVPIDQKLGLKEKISTALFIRNASDPFSRAAVKDAEQTAQQVVLKLNEHFPIAFPRPAIATCALALVAWASYSYINPDKFFGREEAKKVAQAEKQQVELAKQSVARALATVQAMPASVADIDAIKLAKEELAAMLEKPITDPTKANRTAVRALQDVQDALKQQVKNSAKYANSQNEMKMFQSMQKPVEGQGPVSDAHRAIAEGKFEEAISDLEKTIENFDKMDKADQAKAAEQMQKLSQQLQQMATNNPAQEQKQQQQLQQQMGMNKEQAKQAQQLMQQAAQGDKQAQQQLQQMAQQAMQQAGMNQQQQQAMQQMMQQMQAQANAQNQAQQMQQAAQQMAQAMQQAQQGQQQQGQQAQQAQQGQQGQQGQQQGQNQGMQQAMQQMQAQLQQMQAAQQDQQQIQAAQQAAQQAQGQAAAAMGNGQPGQQGNNPGAWANANNNNGNPGQQNNPNPQAGFAGQNQGQQGAGPRDYKQQAPYNVKQEIDPTQDDEKGRILASSLIKDNNPLKGKSSEALKQIADRAANEQTDEVEQERITRPAQKAVKDYFSTIAKDAQQQ